MGDLEIHHGKEVSDAIEVTARGQRTDDLVRFIKLEAYTAEDRFKFGLSPSVPFASGGNVPQEKRNPACPFAN